MVSLQSLTRESWLIAAKDLLVPRLFRPAGYSNIPNMRFSVGWPLGTRKSKSGTRAIGQCWSHTASKDGVFEIFISPEIDDPSRTLDILIHEMVHAIIGIEAGHGPDFRRCALAVGLTGPMRATVASDSLKDRLAAWLPDLPTFPHAALEPSTAGSRRKPTGEKTQTTRMIKLECTECSYAIRTTRKWIDIGLPTCACGGSFDEVIK